MSGPVVLTLGSWAQQHMREMMTAKSKNDFDRALDTMIGPDATVTVNGKHMTREQYRQMMWRDDAGEISGNVNFRETVEVPKSQQEVIQTGEVGMFLEAYIHRIDGSYDTNIRSSMNMVVEDASRRPRGDPLVDGRRATSINQVMTDRGSFIQGREK